MTIEQHLRASDEVIEQKWQHLCAWLQERFDREPTIESILFLIGIQAQGTGPRSKLPKEVKQDLIMEGTHNAFESIGLYHRIGMDEKGRWLWERTTSEFPQLAVEEQEKLLRIAILTYFDTILKESNAPKD